MSRYILTRYRSAPMVNGGAEWIAVLQAESSPYTRTTPRGESVQARQLLPVLVACGNESDVADLASHLLDTGQVADAGVVRAHDIVRSWRRACPANGGARMHGGALVLRAWRAPDVGRRVHAFLRRAESLPRVAPL